MPEKKKVVKIAKPKAKIEQSHLKNLLTHQRHTRPLPKTMTAYTDNAKEPTENKYLKHKKKK